ncbi:avidin/streptavidin family protein [Streptomyces sp. RB6PN25]|uniref:Streptavidin n=1 Tax=Streptomyces humicola TaxID=2953240 RepID=A0ABT1Q519_9ACTN|nr:avidin/streptavidin family protein [Streptomyces humicola]MCQ4083885.1 avidin/streptavidin family protein [Streptomyces humicola]
MNVAGDWYNELGSHMRMTTDPLGGIIGTYVSATGHSAGPYALVGRYETTTRPGYGTVLGWTVAWHNDRSDAESVTSWNGMYLDDGGDERIYATWLLTTVATETNAWECTTVGQDTFTRQVPELDQAALHIRLGTLSEPADHPADTTAMPTR